MSISLIVLTVRNRPRCFPSRPFSIVQRMRARARSTKSEAELARPKTASSPAPPQVAAILVLHFVIGGEFQSIVPPTDTNTGPAAPPTPIAYAIAGTPPQPCPTRGGGGGGGRGDTAHDSCAPRAATYVGIGFVAPSEDGGATVLQYFVEQALSEGLSFPCICAPAPTTCTREQEGA